MRQRKNNLFSPGNWASASVPNDEDDNRSNSSHSENSLVAIHPDEEMGPRVTEAASEEATLVTRGRFFLRDWNANQAKWAQCLTIALSALATYSYHNIGATANVQVSIMTVITLVGASPFCRTHLTTAAIGTFVGGQNIIGATGNLQDAPNVRNSIITSYLWLLVLSMGVGSVWCWFITHPRIKLLDGYSGRLGSTTFIGMNLVMVILWGPLGVVGWNRYYYGLIDIVHVAEEDSAPPSLASAWSWTEEAELAIGYVLAVLWIGILSGYTRLQHNKYIQEWHNNHREQDPRDAPAPLNNVLIPVLWTLASILVANASGYQHAVGLYNGFAVGAYVGMASLKKVPSVLKFAIISLLAALWGLGLTPFFVGFAGKSGFTSMLGHVTQENLEIVLWDRIRKRLQRKQRLQQEIEAQEEEQRLQERLRQQQEEEEKQRLLNEQQIREDKKQQKALKALEPYHPPHKPSRKKELVFSTKQQRRQQQRLRQQQQKMQQEQQQPSRTTQGRVKSNENVAPLRHRAWVATPADGDGVWEHPQLHEDPASSKATKLDVI